jgi:hypothetical protein
MLHQYHFQITLITEITIQTAKAVKATWQEGVADLVSKDVLQ